MKKLSVFSSILTVFVLTMMFVSCITIGLKPDTLPTKEAAGTVLALADEAEKGYDDFLFALGIARDELTANLTAENDVKLKKLNDLEAKVVKTHDEYYELYTEVKTMLEAYVEGKDAVLQDNVDKLNRLVRRLMLEIAIRSTI